MYEINEDEIRVLLNSRGFFYMDIYRILDCDANRYSDCSGRW